MARRRPSGRSLSLQVVVAAVALVMSIFVLLRSGGEAEGEAFAAPPAARGAAMVASAAPSGSAASAPDAGGGDAAKPGADAGPTPAEESPLDRAIAPDGGVPFHPSGTPTAAPSPSRTPVPPPASAWECC